MRLNEVPESAVEDAIEQLTARRSSMSMVAANREVTALIRDGAPDEIIAEYLGRSAHA